MDGAGTTANIGPGGDFPYDFSVPDPGTYWAHPHVGVKSHSYICLSSSTIEPGRPLRRRTGSSSTIGRTIGSPQRLYGEPTDPNKPTMRNTTGMPKAKALTATCSAATGDHRTI